ncbi:4-hydroxy-tetrahydrodipicolinate synthase [Thermosulfurimonas marina]|uniref:4-hydroxy-tetrahydrodipicolinate synthase n=1 Tax=Thermosulfurimonas marina TaxID=2047767 RepID=A0A6H1WRP4_9BACT|nr:4-hydroxy-tetrahydrodipicolinate synthase [Thermosulfurimonas marina]QJA05851.1 4-hydroxy-tetrahydrodipicolinate synthase [Thermosulfurimonas marina]
MPCGRKRCKNFGPEDIKGSIVAIVTPFKEDGTLDEEGFRELVRWHLKEKTHGLVVVGTTGESATLSKEEKARVFEIALEEAKGKVPVILGTGTNNTAASIELTKMAQEMGADAVLMVTPYYNKPTQEGLFRHYEAVAREVKVPIILYNVPGRTSVNLAPETVARLSKIRNIIGIKEATGCMKQATEIFRLCGNKFRVFSGDDFTAFGLMALGGHGVISVAANVVPREMARFMEACLKGKWDQARRMHFKLYPLFKALFLETNPVPAKAALALMGKIASPTVRLPLAPMSEANLEKLREVLKDYGLI